MCMNGDVSSQLVYSQHWWKFLLVVSPRKQIMSHAGKYQEFKIYGNELFMALAVVMRKCATIDGPLGGTRPGIHSTLGM